MIVTHSNHGRGVMEAGWYPDPDDPAARRYWDGREWSAPLTTAAPAAAPPVAGASSSSPSWVKPFAVITLILGAVLLGVGLFLGESGLSVSGTNCGTAFGGISSDAYSADYTNALEGGLAGTAISDTCRDRLDSRDTVAKAVLWPGVALLAVAIVTFIAVSARTSPTEPPA